MFHCPKSLAVAVAEWASGSGDDGDRPLAWELTKTEVRAALGDWRFQSWYQYQRRGHFPFPGAWLDQPLAWLVLVQVLTFIDQLFTGRFADGFNFEKLTPLQLAVLTWIEKDEEAV